MANRNNNVTWRVNTLCSVTYGGRLARHTHSLQTRLFLLCKVKLKGSFSRKTKGKILITNVYCNCIRCRNRVFVWLPLKFWSLGGNTKNWVKVAVDDFIIKLIYIFPELILILTLTPDFILTTGGSHTFHLA